MKQIFFFAVLSLVFVLFSCEKKSNEPGHGSENIMTRKHNGNTRDEKQQNSQPDMHALHDSLANSFSHKGIVILDAPYLLSKPAKAEMEQVIDIYLQLKDALVKDDEIATDKSAELLAESVVAVNPTHLNGKGLEAWQNHKTLYEAKLKEMRHSKGLENKRPYFSHISEIMYCMIKSFGLKQGDLFAVFCPTTFDGKGAYWISGDKEIRNPYSGKRTPTCGEIKEKL